jgi:hypothetical protein
MARIISRSHQVAQDIVSFLSFSTIGAESILRAGKCQNRYDGHLIFPQLHSAYPSGHRRFLEYRPLPCQARDLAKPNGKELVPERSCSSGGSLESAYLEKVHVYGLQLHWQSIEFEDGGGGTREGVARNG